MGLALNLGLWVGAAAAGSIVAILGWLCRTRVVAGARELDEVLGQGRPVVVCFWHDRSIAVMPFLRRRLQRRGLSLTLMASMSRDGELVARLARMLRTPVVRGSSSRGGLEAIRALHRAIVRRGSSPLIAPDGPRGPAYVAKEGAIVLSQVSGAPILPISCAVSRCWKLKSWDRLIVPRPFASIDIAIGEPVVVPRQLDSKGIEKARYALETELQRLGQVAASARPR